MSHLSDRGAWIGGLITGGVSLLGALAIGTIGDTEARHLLASTLPTTRFLCSALITAAATMLALMLTLLGLSLESPGRLKDLHYQRVRKIAFFLCIAFIAATLFLLLLSIPLEHSDNVPASAFSLVYYAILALSSGIAGLLVSIVLMLYGTIADIIEVIGLQREDHPLLDGEAGEAGSMAESGDAQ